MLRPKIKLNFCIYLPDYDIIMNNSKYEELTDQFHYQEYKFCHQSKTKKFC